MIHSFINFYSECSFPKAFSLSYLIYGMIITAFFINFYVQSYIKRLTSQKNVLLNGETDKEK